jgi:membrane protein required for colicin V production
MELNTLDYVVLFVIVLSGLLALLRGFVRELVLLIALAGAFFTAIYYYSPALPLVERYIKDETFAKWAAMAVVFTVVSIILSIAGHFVCKLIKGDVMTTIDRSMGFLFGLARGVVVVSAIYLVAQLVMWPDIDAPAAEQEQDKDRNHPPEMLLGAKTRPMMAFGANILIDLLPQEMVNKQLKKVDGRKHDMLGLPEKATSEDTVSDSGEDDEIRGPVDIEKLFNREKDQ